MKLYTEEQVDIMLSRARMQKQDDTYMFTNEYLLSQETPIELPSDEDICDEAESIAHNYFVMQRNHYQGLDEGAKRMAYWLMKNFKQQRQ